MDNLKEYLLLKELKGKEICFVDSKKELLDKQSKFKEMILFLDGNLDIKFLDKLKIPFILSINNLVKFNGVLLR